MPEAKDYGSVGVLIHKTDDGEVRKVTQNEMKEPVAVMENTSTKKRWVQGLGTHTDVIMAPDSTINLTLEDIERGVPNEIKGTGVKKKKYDPDKHEHPHPMTGGAPDMQPVDARDSLPPDHPARKALNRIERELGKPLCGKGSKEEVHKIAEEATEIAGKVIK